MKKNMGETGRTPGISLHAPHEQGKEMSDSADRFGRRVQGFLKEDSLFMFTLDSLMEYFIYPHRKALFWALMEKVSKATFTTYMETAAELLDAIFQEHASPGIMKKPLLYITLPYKRTDNTPATVFMLAETRDAMDRQHEYIQETLGNPEDNQEDEQTIQEMGNIYGYPRCCIDRFIHDQREKHGEDRMKKARTLDYAFTRYHKQVLKNGRIPIMHPGCEDSDGRKRFIITIPLMHGFRGKKLDIFHLGDHVPCRPLCRPTLQQHAAYTAWRQILDDTLQSIKEYDMDKKTGGEKNKGSHNTHGKKNEKNKKEGRQGMRT